MEYNLALFSAMGKLHSWLAWNWTWVRLCVRDKGSLPGGQASLDLTREDLVLVILVTVSLECTLFKLDDSSHFVSQMQIIGFNSATMTWMG